MSTTSEIHLNATIQRRYVLICVPRDYIDMIRDKWLSDVHFTTVQTHVDLSAVRNSQGDYNVGDLSRAVNTQQTNDITVRAWLEKAGTAGRIIFF